MMMVWRQGKPCIFAQRVGPGDLVVITLVGKRVAELDHVRDYDRAIQRALRLADETKAIVKVLCTGLMEACIIARIPFDYFMADMSNEELRERTIAACVPLLDHPNPRQRQEARALLEHWGAIQ
jgi:hypothetical protein